MEIEVEIIDFCEPRENSKNLYITNIIHFGCVCSAEHVIQECLYKACSRFGLVYEVQVFLSQSNNVAPTSCLENGSVVSSRSSDCGQTEEKDYSEPPPVCSDCQGQQPLTTQSCYAFVKFFSRMAARKAKRSLHLTHFAGKEACKVNFAKRRKPDEREGVLLYVSRCRELANHFLGYNGWSSSVRLLAKESGDVPQSSADQSQNTSDRPEPSREWNRGPPQASREWSCAIVYTAEISLPRHGLRALGVGECEQTLPAPGIQAKIQATALCHKRALERALQNAFSKILLVVSPDGKVYPEVDTTKSDPINFLYGPEETRVVAVNQLEEEPEEESSEGEQEEEEEMDNTAVSETDQINMDILQHLDDGS
ncbi:RAD52 motif-containing protein 1 [Aplysia californica]|uniref:RAD52 motif-containing protein 1 n=1 Tax=Aplysia californica TaxID=6500 RepID=A0ABM0ZYB1_APLCA|nr:RAD52 motif-containing protein 1 [Aplysia californica]